MEPHFFQLLDRIRFEAALSALCRDGKSLAVVSSVQALAEHYKDALIERLPKEVPGVKIKAFFPADTDAIVQSFNKVVADMPLTRAMGRPAEGQAMEVWVVHDAAALPAGEVMMMLDLLDKFPGAHVRALLVFAGTQIAPEGLESFDKSLMRWQIERPGLDQIKDSLSRITDESRLAQVRDLITRMAPGHVKVPSVSATGVAGTAVAGAPASANPVQANPSAPASGKPAKRAGWKIFGVVAALLLLSSAVAAWLNPQAVARLLGTESQEAKVENTPATTPASPDKAAEASPDKTPDKTPDNTADNKSEATNPSAAAQAPDKASADQAAPDKAAIKEEAPIELPAAVMDGQKWARKFPRGTFVVQHAYADTYAKARERLKRFPNLSEAKVVPQYEAGQSQAKFALISGPFESKELADAFLKSDNMPKESWVRSSRAIQKRLVPKDPQPAKP